MLLNTKSRMNVSGLKSALMKYEKDMNVYYLEKDDDGNNLMPIDVCLKTYVNLKSKMGNTITVSQLLDNISNCENGQLIEFQEKPINIVYNECGIVVLTTARKG